MEGLPVTARDAHITKSLQNKWKARKWARENIPFRCKCSFSPASTFSPSSSRPWTESAGFGISGGREWGVGLSVAQMSSDRRSRTLPSSRLGWACLFTVPDTGTDIHLVTTRSRLERRDRLTASQLLSGLITTKKPPKIRSKQKVRILLGNVTRAEPNWRRQRKGLAAAQLRRQNQLEGCWRKWKMGEIFHLPQNSSRAIKSSCSRRKNTFLSQIWVEMDNFRTDRTKIMTEKSNICKKKW